MFAKDQFAAIVTILLVWGFAGALFGALFASLYLMLWLFGLAGWQILMIAAATAAVTTSAFYSAMPVALVGALAGVLASIGHLIVAGQEVDLDTILVITGVAGLAAGSFYTWIVKSGNRSLGVTLAGLGAGLLAGATLLVGLAVAGKQTSMFVLAAGVVALVGTYFQLSERWLVALTARWLPAAVSASLVAGMIAAVVGASIWILGGAAGRTLEASGGSPLGLILHDVSPGLMGGCLGGVLTGLLLELFGFHLEDHA